MAISRLMKRLFNEAVAVLVGEVVVPDGAGGAGARASPAGTPHTVCAALGSHGVVRSIPPFLNFEVSGGAIECSLLQTTCWKNDI